MTTILTKHTPGEWTKEIQPSKRGLIRTINAGTIRIAEICFVSERPQGMVETEANARLIAAAPELLEALKDCLNWMDKVNTSDEGDQAQQRGRAAIAKAEGQ